MLRTGVRGVGCGVIGRTRHLLPPLPTHYPTHAHGSRMLPSRTFCALFTPSARFHYAPLARHFCERLRQWRKRVSFILVSVDEPPSLFGVQATETRTSAFALPLSTAAPRTYHLFMPLPATAWHACARLLTQTVTDTTRTRAPHRATRAATVTDTTTFVCCVTRMTRRCAPARHLSPVATRLCITPCLIMYSHDDSVDLSDACSCARLTLGEQHLLRAPPYAALPVCCGVPATYRFLYLLSLSGTARIRLLPLQHALCCVPLYLLPLPS